MIPDQEPALTWNAIHELRDEEGGLSLYAKGHHDAVEFLAAAAEYLEREYEDWYLVPDDTKLVEWGWARFVPHPEYGCVL